MIKITKASVEDVNKIYNNIKQCADDMAKNGLKHWIPYYSVDNIRKDILNNNVFLVNYDKIELERRISMRDVISDFDKEAYQYNQLYFETYQYMMEHDMLEGKLFLVDCTNLTLNEQVEKVKDIIMK